MPHSAGGGMGERIAWSQRIPCTMTRRDDIYLKVDVGHFDALTEENVVKRDPLIDAVQKEANVAAEQTGSFSKISKWKVRHAGFPGFRQRIADNRRVSVGMIGGCRSIQGSGRGQINHETECIARFVRHTVSLALALMENGGGGGAIRISKLVHSTRSL